MSEKTFKFYIGDESRVVIEDSEKKENSIFGEAYSQAFDALNDLLGNIESDTEYFNNSNSNDKRDEKSAIQKNTPRNNIFAFVGNRGTGKTSCMMSFAKMLQENKQTLVNIQKKKFEVLESTDPSFFTQTKNILEIFVGRLFSRFKEKVEYGSEYRLDNDNDKNRVFEAFERVKEALSYMNKEKICDEDTVDQLVGLGASVELQESIHELVSRFLKYVHMDFLVIPVDDIDLHSIYAFEMAEQIRKYLVQDNTIILMALRIEQLQYAIERHYIDHYKLMLDKESIDKSEISDMASKYLIKFIPADRRFRLKSVEELSNEFVDIVDGTKKIEDIFLTKMPAKTLKNKILGLIEAGTGIYFHYEHKQFPLVPETLRELRNFIIFIYRMLKNKRNDSQRYNRQRLWLYIANDWACNYCDKIGFELLKNLGQFSIASGINKHVVSLLAELWKNTNDAEVKQIVDKENLNANISVGDVLALIHYIESIEEDKRKHNLLFAIKFFYVMLLHREHNMFADKSILNDEFSRFIGNSLINVNDVSNRLRNVGHRFDYKVVPLKKIHDLIDDPHMLTLVEFFVLSLNREFFVNDDDQYRKKTGARLLKQNFKEYDYVYFDVFSVFVNLQDIKNCYRRFSPSLLDKVLCENSLFSSLSSCNLEMKSIDEIEEILSCTNEIDLRDEIAQGIDEYKNSQMEEYMYEKIKVLYEKMKEKFKSKNNPIQIIYDNVFGNDNYKYMLGKVLTTIQIENENKIEEIYDYFKNCEMDFLNKRQGYDYFRISDLLPKIDGRLDESVYNKVASHFDSAMRDRRIENSPEGYQIAIERIIRVLKRNFLIY